MTRHELHCSAITFLIGMSLLLPMKANGQPGGEANREAVVAPAALLAQEGAGMAPSGAAMREWRAASAETLDACRGGFTTPSGLELSLGIERLVTINGDVVAHTTFQFGDIGAMTGEQSAAVRAGLSAGKIIQNGPNNFYAGALDHVFAGTLVQNTLNDQTIRNQTIISSTVNSLSLLKDLNFLGTMRDAAIGAIGFK